LWRNANELIDIQGDVFNIVLYSMTLRDVEDLDGALNQIYKVKKMERSLFLFFIHVLNLKKTSRF